MANGRKSEPPSERAAEYMVHQLRQTSGHLIKQLSDRIPLADVYKANVWATFDMLEMALRAKRMFVGKMPPAPGDPPAAKISERVEIFKEMLEVISDELLACDPSHDYAVGMIKRRRGHFKP